MRYLPPLRCVNSATNRKRIGEPAASPVAGSGSVKNFVWITFGTMLILALGQSSRIRPRQARADANHVIAVFEGVAAHPLLSPRAKVARCGDRRRAR